MFALRTAETELQAVVALLDPESLDDQGALDAVDAFDRIERLAAAGKAVAAARVERSDIWRGHGARDAIGFLAARTRSTYARIRDAIAVTDRLGDLALVDRALRDGELTIDQAADIAAAAGEHPDTEAELVTLASTATRRQLKARCVEILAEGKGAEEQHRRAQAERSMSSNVGRDGIWRSSVRLPIIDGAYLDKALDHFQTQIFDEARRRGDREPFDAYRADALVAMAKAAMDEEPSCGCADSQDQPGADDQAAGNNRASRRTRRRRRSSSTRHAIVITVPHTTFLTGAPVAGETCQIPGVGPVPVSVVHRLLDDDPIIKAIVTKGRDITALATITRSLKDDLRLAVLAANDLTCGVATCDNTRFLEIDHEWEYHQGGPTSYDNLRPLCSFHHRQRTDEGYELRGNPGSYQWISPDGTILAAEQSAVPI
ncbi:MAG: HNH endonuclease [Acidimicrobiales bacterium]|nr:HNH endonuclease [Acidimicrobiales bacterium]